MTTHDYLCLYLICFVLFVVRQTIVYPRLNTNPRYWEVWNPNTGFFGGVVMGLAFLVPLVAFG